MLCLGILFGASWTSVVAQESVHPVQWLLDKESSAENKGQISKAKDSTQNSAAQPEIGDSLFPISLDMYEYWVADTSASASFRLHVRNTADSLVVVTRVEPSCGCIMTTVQKSYARKGKDAEIYIGLMTNRMSEIQPYTVDVYTNINPDIPLRLYIRKKLNEQPNNAE